MRFYLRAMSYFKQDLLLIGSVLLLIGLSVCVGVLQAWPLGMMADALAGQHPTDWIHRVFSSLQLPFAKDNTGLQIVGIALVGMFLKVGSGFDHAVQEHAAIPLAVQREQPGPHGVVPKAAGRSAPTTTAISLRATPSIV